MPVGGCSLLPAIRPARPSAHSAADIGIARRKRCLPVADFAVRMGVSQGTLIRLEKGEAGVSIGAVAMALLALGELRRMEDILDVSRDDTGLMLDVDSLPKRIRRQKTGLRG